MFSVEHAFSTDAAVMEEGGAGGGGTNRLPSCKLWNFHRYTGYSIIIIISTIAVI